MSFQEVHVSQFTSATTPYTACRHKDGFFATTTHSLHCTVKKDTVKVSTGPLPPSREHCVGHDQSGAWHLFAFLDSDDEHVMRNVSSETAPSANQRVSHASLEASALRSMEASLSSLPDVEHPTAEAQDDDDDDTTIAWLVLRSREELAPTFTAPLAFRPLSPLLTCPLSQYSEDELRVVAWVGSADDSNLRCYIPVQEDDNVALLKQVKLKKKVFSFDSPVMVMDSLEGKNQEHWIAVGCQDGTVRIISFAYTRTDDDSLDFTKLVAHTVLVDGPIIALHLSHEKGDGEIHLLVGSMCGFACGMKKTRRGWQGPWMVAEGFWNSSLDSEDAILAVNKLSNNMVAVGTHSGLCCVYQKRQGDNSCQLLWKVQLPYSIHGLCHINVSSSGQPSLLVTTRYTFHVFQRNVPKYSADTAKRRIEKLISQRQDATELLNLA